MNTLVNTLKAWREKNLYSQAKAAQILGVSRSYLNQIENGRQPGPELVNTFQQHLRGQQQKTENQSPRINEDEGIYGPRSLLKQRRTQLGLSLKDVAEMAGYPSSVIRNIEEGHNRASERLLTKLAQVLDLPLDELMDGSDMPRITGYGNTFGDQPNVKTEPGISARTIPLISWAQAGQLQTWEDVYEHEGIIAYNTKDPRAVAITIRGDSMAPEYKEGTIAIIYPAIPAKNGDLVIARLSDGSVLFKRLQINGNQYTFVSLNPVYPPIVVDKTKVEKIAPVGATQKTEIL